MTTTITLTKEEVKNIIRDYFYNKIGHAKIKDIHPNVSNVTTGYGLDEKTTKEFMGYTVVMEDE